MLAALALAAGALVAPGCAMLGGTNSTGPRAQVRIGDFALLGAPTSDSEQEGRLAHADKGELNEKALTGSFWGGVIVGSVGGAAAVGFAAAGAAATDKIADGYGEGISVERRDELVSRGGAYNGIAITGATLAITGFAVAAIAHGIDASRCGPRRRKRDGCTAN